MTSDTLLLRAKTLKLYGIIAHWEEIIEKEFIEKLITWEETERSHRGLERRLNGSHIGRFKQLVDFDWDWPKKCDREAIEELMQLEFIKKATYPLQIGG
jgi:hypothetical protein